MVAIYQPIEGQVVNGEEQVTFGDTPLCGDEGPIMQHERELSMYPPIEQLTYDTQLNAMLGQGGMLVNPSTRRLLTEQAWAPEQSVYGVMSRASDEVRINLSGQATVALQLLGTWTGTVSFNGTLDGNTWYSLSTLPAQLAPTATSATVNGQWRFAVAGLMALRVVFTTATTGTPRALLVSSAVPFTPAFQGVVGSVTGLQQHAGTWAQTGALPATFYPLYTDDAFTQTQVSQAKDALQEILPWIPWADYMPGDTVLWNGQVYVCVSPTAPLVATTARPYPTNATYWKLDPRQNKSCVTSLPASKPDAARVRVEIDNDAYSNRLQENQLLIAMLARQEDMLQMDAMLSVQQGQGAGYGKNYAMGTSGMSKYTFEEIR